jgi:Peptidase M16 inactive domain
MRKYGQASMRSILVPLLVFSSSGLAAGRASAPGRVSSKPANIQSSDWGRPVTGRLGNGVRFAILPRQGSEPGVALLMRNEGGFIAERRPGERGLSHLIEHIVLHSPTIGAPDDLDHFKRIGMPLTLPAPNAGSTSWREANYYLSTRTAAPGDLDALLTLFREAAAGMTLRADAVDTSRGEVIREMADKKLGNEIYANYIAAIAPGSPNDVIDAQNSDDVPTASIDTIRDLYGRLYRPENMMIVIVGDVKTDEVRALIQKRFGDWKRTKPAPRQTPFPMFQRDRIHGGRADTCPVLVTRRAGANGGDRPACHACDQQSARRLPTCQSARQGRHVHRKRRARPAPDHALGQLHRRSVETGRHGFAADDVRPRHVRLHGKGMGSGKTKPGSRSGASRSGDAEGRERRTCKGPLPRACRWPPPDPAR